MVGNYDVVWNSCEEKIIFCANLRRQAFNDDIETLYNVLVQYIGTSGTGSDIVSIHTRSNSGRKCYLEPKINFKTEAYEETKASKVNVIIQIAHYDENRNFTLEHYHNFAVK